MDPDETLRQLRSAIIEYRQATDPGQKLHAADRVVDHAEAIDHWLVNGGFPPAARNQAGNK
jgi:hypothetical protein